MKPGNDLISLARIAGAKGCESWLGSTGWPAACTGPPDFPCANAPGGPSFGYDHMSGANTAPLGFPGAGEPAGSTQTPGFPPGKPQTDRCPLDPSLAYPI